MKTLDTENLKIKQPTLCIFVAGFAASGKSYTGKRIAKELNATYLDKDTITKELTDCIATSNGSYSGDRDSQLFINTIIPLEYAVTINTAIENLELGNNVVISAPFTSYVNSIDKMNEFKQRIESVENCILKVVWISASFEVQCKNINKRAEERDLYKINNWDEYMISATKFTHINVDYLREFNNNNHSNFERELTEILSWISSPTKKQ